MSFDIGGVISGIAQAQAAAQAAAVQMRALQLQKRIADRNNRLATAPRTDAYGNKQGYDDLLNEWTLDLTPQQQQIITAGEQEQFKTLTEDAARRRRLHQSQEQRAGVASDAFDETFANYKYDQPRDSKAIQGDLERLTGSERSRAAAEVASAMARQATRLGRGGDIAGIMKGSQDALGEGLASSMLQARDAARSEATTERGLHEQEHLPKLQFLAGLMDQVGSNSPMMSGTPDAMGALQADQIGRMMSANQQESSNVGGAYSALAQTIASSAPRFSFSLPMGGGGQKEKPQPLVSLGPTTSLFDPNSMSFAYQSPYLGQYKGTPVTRQDQLF